VRGIVVALPEHLLPGRGGGRDGLGCGRNGRRHEALRAAAVAGAGAGQLVGHPGSVPLLVVVVVLLLGPRRPRGGTAATAVRPVPADGDAPLRRICRETNRTGKLIGPMKKTEIHDGEIEHSKRNGTGTRLTRGCDGAEGTGVGAPPETAAGSHHRARGRGPRSRRRRHV
jgi:hypothetical protein